MNKFVRPTEVGGRSGKSKKSAKRRSGIMLLEPRVMYDGAAAASAGHHHHHEHADASSGAGAPIQGPPVTGELATPPNGANPNSHNYGSRPDDWSNATSGGDHGGSHHGQNVVFVDSTIPDYQAIVAAINPGTKVFVFDGTQDGLQQIANDLQGMHHLASIDIISHGASGEVQVGTDTLTTGSISNYSADLAAIGKALAPNGQLDLYGCDVAAAGDGFIDALQQAIGGRNVAASTDATGATALGGNWTLEATTGATPDALPADLTKLQAFDDVLATPTVTQTVTLTTDADGDGGISPGDTVTAAVTITNTGTTPLTGTALSEALNGLTALPSTVEVTPIAVTDTYSLTGNTPITIDAAHGVLANDIEFNNSALTAINATNVVGGTVTLNADGSFTFTPTTGFSGTASFQYTAHDALGLNSDQTATVTLNVTAPVWYVDSAAPSAGADGSFAHAFTTIAQAVTAAANDTNAGPNSHGVNNIIFVENAGATYTAASGIALASGEQLLGDGSSLTQVNGNTVGLSATNSTFSVSAGTAVTLGSGDTISGININETGTGAGIVDGGSTIGAFSMSNVHVSTGAGAGISLTHGGTVTGSGDVISSTGGGVALNVTSTNIGSAGLSFTSISDSGGATNGIILANTGTVGRLTVTGDGLSSADGSGGTITGTTGDGVLLTNADGGVVLTHMYITNTKGNGVFGSGVNGFVSDWNVFSANGASSGDVDAGAGIDNDSGKEGAINLINLTGGAIGSATETRIDDTTISGALDNGVSITDSSGTLTQFDVHNTTIQGSKAGSGMLVTMSGGVAAFDLQNSAFGTATGGGNFNSGFEANVTGNSTLFFTAANNSFANNSSVFNSNGADAFASGINIESGGNAKVTSYIAGNTFTGNVSEAIQLHNDDFNVASSTAVLSTEIINNTITTPTASEGGGAAIDVDVSGSPTADILISGNTITSNDGVQGIVFNTTTPGGAAIVSVVVTNNMVTMNASGAFGVSVDDRATGAGSSLVDIENNAVYWGTNSSQSGAAIYLESNLGPTMNVEQGSHGTPGNNVGVPAIESLLAANNPKAHLPIHEYAGYTPEIVYMGTGKYAGKYNIVTNTAPIVVAPPTITTPTISGTAQEGVTLSANVAGSTGGGATTFQWQETFGGSATNFVAINGATGSTYTLTEADIGAQLRVVATTVATDGFRTEAISLDTATVTDHLTVTPPVISGTLQVGQILTASATADNADATITYQWQDDGVNISGATGQTYRLTTSDVRHTIDVVATATDPHGGSASLTTTANGTVAVFTPLNLSNLSFASLPGSAQFTVIFQATVNAQSNGFIVNSTIGSTLSGTGFSNVTANTTVTLDTLTLGGFIFDDANADGVFNVGDTTISGVSVSVFVQGGTTALETVTTNGSGNYAFTGLAAGQYFVEINASNFAVGGPLAPFSAPSSNFDSNPNDGAVNRNYGFLSNGVVETKPITLSYRAPANGGDSQTNLDVGFVKGPSVGAGATTTFNGGGGPVTLDAGLTVVDGSSSTLSSATVSIGSGFTAGDTLNFTNNGSNEGNIAVTSNANGKLVLTSAAATATVAQWQTALESITYSFGPVNGDPTAGGADTARTINWTVNDGILTASSTSTLNTVHTAPTVTAGAAVMFIGGGGAVTLDSGLTATDVDSGGMLASATVSIGSGYMAGDTLTFTNTNATTEGNISVSSNANGQLVLTSSGNTATVQQWENALETVTYSFSPTNGDPTNAGIDTTRTIDWTVSDGSSSHGSNTPVATSTLTTVHVAPTVTAGASVAFESGNPTPVKLDSGVTVADVDSAGNLASATVSISGFVVGSGDVLSFTAVGNITGIFNSATGALTLSGADTLADYRTALDSVTFSTTSTTAGTRTIDWSVTDGSSSNGLSTLATSTVNVTAGPHVTAGGTVTFNGGDGPHPLDTGLTLSDPSSATLASATVSIGTGFVTGDTLNFTNTANITGSYNSATGVLTLTGNDTVGDYQTALDSISYSFSPVNGDPTGGGTHTSRTIDWSVSDGIVASNVSTSAVTTVHVAPAVAAGVTTIYETGSTGVNLDAGVSVIDPDSGGHLTGATVSIAAGFDAAHDTLTINGNANGTLNHGANGSISYAIVGSTVTLTGTDTIADYTAVLDSITFHTTATSAGSRTVNWTVTDGVASSAPATSTVSVALGPQVTAGAAVIFDGGVGPVVLDNGLTLSDPFSTTLTSASATIGTAIAGDTLTINGLTSGNINDGGNGTIHYSFANGTMMLTGADTVADYQAALRLITYTNSSNPTGGGTDFSRTISYTITDANAITSPAATSTVATFAAPLLTGGGDTANYTQGGAAVTLENNFGVTDLNQLASLTSATVTIGAGFAAGDTLSFSAEPGITGAYNAATGVLTFTGSSSIANYVAELDSVTFSTTAPIPFGATLTRAISWSVNDSAGGHSNPSAAVTSTVDLLHTDSAPVLSGVANTVLATEQTPVVLDGLATVSDAELGSLNGGQGDYAGASLTIARSGGAASDDSFGFHSAVDPTNGNTLSLSGGAIQSNGVTIATLTSNGGTLTITFTDAGGETVTTALANTVLKNITYTNQSDTPPASVALAWTFSDGNTGAQGAGGARTATGSTTVNITAVDDAPVATITNPTYSAIDGVSLNLKNTGLSVSDVDGGSGIETATLSVGEGVLNVTAGGSGATVTNSGSSTVTISGTVAQIEALLGTDGASTISYTDSNAIPAAHTTLTLSIDDNGNTGTGGPLTSTATSTIDIHALPIVTAGATTGFEIGATAPVTLDPGLTVTDTSSTTLLNAAVSITGGFDSAHDTLSFTNNGTNEGNITGSYLNGTLTLTSAGGTATLAEWRTALDSVAFSTTAAAAGTRTVGFIVNDGTVSSAPATSTVSVVTGPIVTAGASVTFDGGSGPVSLDPGVTLDNQAGTTLASATVTMNNAIGGDTLTINGTTSGTINDGSNGTIGYSFSSSGGTATLVLVGTDTVADYQAALDAVSYSFSPANGDPTGGNGGTTTRTIDWSVNDGAKTSNTATSTLNTVHVAPTVTTSSSTTVVTGSSVAADAGVTVTDPDSGGNLTGAKVSFFGSIPNGATLSFNNNSTTPESFTDGGMIVGSFSAASGVLTLSGTASVADYQAALESVTFTAGTTVVTRSFEWTVSDNVSTSAPAINTIDVVAAGPILTVNTTATFDVGGSAVALSPTVTVTDTDSSVTDLASASVSIIGGLSGDTLSFTNTDATTEGDITVSNTSTGTHLVLTSAGGATLAQWDTALESVTYNFSPSTGDPTDNGQKTTRDVNWTVTDAATTQKSSTAGSTLDIVHAAPVVSGGVTHTFDAGGPPVVINAGTTVTDASSTTLASATVSVSNFQSGDVLGFDASNLTNVNQINGTNITESYNSATGVLTLSGHDTLADYNTALSEVTFSSTAAAPSTFARTITVVASDGTTSGSATDTVNVHDQPVVTAGGTVTFDGGGAAVLLDPTLTLSDPSSATLTLAEVSMSGETGDTLMINGATSGTFDNGKISFTGTGTHMMLSGTDTVAEYQAALASVTYSFTPANGDPTGGGGVATDTLHWMVTDSNGVNSKAATSTLDIVHAAPSVTAAGTATFVGGGTAVTLDSGLTLRDPDSSDTLTGATVTIGNANLLGGDVLTADLTGTNIHVVSDSGGVLTLGGTDTVENYQTVLQHVTYSFNPVDGDPTGGIGDITRTISWAVTDASSHSNIATTTLDTVHVAPTLTAGAVATFAGGGAAVTLDSGITVTDPDSGNTLTSATVSIVGFVNGDTLNYNNTVSDISGAYNSGTGVLTLTGTNASVADFQTALKSITYTFGTGNGDPTAGGGHTTRLIDWSVSDGVATSATATSTLDTVHVAPTLTTSGTVTYDQAGPATPLDSTLSLSDPDSGGLLTGATVQISSGFLTGDTLTASTTGLPSITANYNSATGELTLSGNDTLADYQAVLRSVTFSSSSSDPTNGGLDPSRTVTWTVNDGVSPNPGPETSTVNVHALPAVTAGATATFLGGDPAVVLDQGVTINDVSSATIASATVSIGGFVSGDTLNFTNTSDITGSYNAGTGVETLTGSNASRAEFTAALDSISYSFTTNGDPTGGGSHTARTISWTVTDGNLNSATATSTLTTVHEAPTVTAGATVAFGIGGNAVVLDQPLQVDDVDSGQMLTSATVKISSGFVSGDSLNFTNLGSIIGSYNAGTGVLTLVGNDSLADYKTVLDSITFSTNVTTTGSRTIDWSVTDASTTNGTSATAHSTVEVSLGPQVVAGGTATFTGGGAAVPLDGTPSVTALDPFSTNLSSATVSISGAIAGDTLDFNGGVAFSYNDGGSITGSFSGTTLTLTGNAQTSIADFTSALDAVTYSFTANGDPTGGGSHTSRTIDWTVSDGHVNSDIATSTLATVHVPPTITAGTTATYEIGSTAPVPLVGTGSVAVNDVDSLGNLTGATVSISGFVAGSGDTLNFTNTPGITGSFNSATGVLTLNGADTLADYQAALDSITFTTTGTSTASHTIDWTVTDGVKNASATSTLNVISGPQVTAAGAATFNGGDGPQPLASLTLVDASSPTIANATVTIGGFISGDTLNFANTADITGSYNASTGVETLTGTNASAADFVSALDSITYSFAANGDPTGGGSHTTRTISWSVNDGVANSNTATTALDTVHTAPTVATATQPAGTFGIGGSAVPIDANLTVTDPDSGGKLASATVTIGAGYIAGEDALGFVNNGTNEGNISVSSNSGNTLVLTSSGDTATLAEWDAALQAVTFITTSTAAGTSRDIGWTVSDNVSSSTQAHSTLEVVLGPQISAGATATYTAGEISQVLDGAIIVADPVSPTLTSATVTIAGAISGDTLSFLAEPSIEGDITLGAGSTSSQLILTSARGATFAQWEAALDSVRYIFNGNADLTVGGAQPTRTIDWVVSDGTHTSATATSTLDLVHAAPVVSAGVSATFQGGGGPVVLDGTLTVADIDSGGNLDAASVQISAGFLTGDTLTADTTGTGITASYDAVHGILALNGNASLATYQTVLDSVTYSFSPTHNDPTGGGSDTFRVVTWVASDGVSNSTASVSALNVVHVAPTVVAGAAPTFTGGGSPVVLDGALTVADVDSANMLVGATVSISSGFVAGDTLTIDGFTNGSINDGASGTINYAFSGSTLTLSGADTVADYQTVLDRVTYHFNPVNGDPTGAAANSTSRTISWVANDGSSSNGTNAPVTSTLNVVHVAPDLTAGASATFTGGGAAIALDGGLSLSDVDSNGNLTGATVSISSGLLNGDMLNFTNQNGITGSYDAATGVLTLSGTARVGNYQTALDSINYSFNSANGDPTGGAAGDTNRTISWVVTDGAVTNGNAVATSGLTTVHVAPSYTAGNTVDYTQNQSAQPLDSALHVTDVDSNGNLTGATVSISSGFFAGDQLTFTSQNGITGSYDAAHGVLTLTGTASIGDYNAVLDSISISSTSPNPSNDGANLTRTISWSVTDGALSNGITTATSTVNVHAVPTIVAGTDVNFTSGPNQSVVLDADLGAFDGTSITGATVTIATGFQSGEILNANTAGTNITASYNASDGVLTLTGKDTPQDYQAVLRSVTMTGNAPNGGPVTIAWQITDQSNLTSKIATSTVEVAGSLVPPLLPQVQSQIPGNFDHGHFGDFSGMLTNAQFGGPAGLNFGAGGAVNVIHLDVNATVADNGTIGFDVAVNQLEAALDGDVVSVTATLADGKPLPGWLNFDSDTGQFAGLLPDNFATGSIGHDGGFSDGQGGSSGPQLMTIEVIARDSKGNLAITDFTIDLSTVTAHRGDRHGWNLLPLGPHRDIGPLHAMNSPMDHVLWHGVPDLDADRVHAGHHGSDVAPPAGRAGFSDQIKAHGWNAVAAQRMALLDSLRQGVAGWR